MNIIGAKDTWSLLGLATVWENGGATLVGSGTCKTVASLPYKVIKNPKHMIGQ